MLGKVAMNSLTKVAPMSNILRRYIAHILTPPSNETRSQILRLNGAVTLCGGIVMVVIAALFWSIAWHLALIGAAFIVMGIVARRIGSRAE